MKATTTPPLTKAPLPIQGCKLCNCCGARHFVIPAGSAYAQEGVYFNCECGSTMLVKSKALVTEAEMLELGA